MMFQLFEAIAGRVSDQAADYASAQARIVARTLTQAANPWGFALVGIAASPVAVDEPDACPAQARSDQRVRGS